MNADEFAFFNQQLAGMLRTGIPLEDALRQLSRGMKNRQLRTEIELLEIDLSQGVPMKMALAKRKLPEIYRRVVIAGVESQNLPGLLTLLADYYSKVSSLTAKLKGLMVYPIIVLISSLVISIFLGLVYSELTRQAQEILGRTPPEFAASFWLAPLFFLGLLGLFVGCIFLPGMRRWLRWKVPGFRDTSLAQNASAMSLMLESGTQLDNALALLEETENRSPGGRDLTRWRALLKSGAGKFHEMAAGSRAFPPLFIWLVAQSEQDLALGFRRASEIYEVRAQNRTDMLLYAALPLAIVFLGFLMLGEVYSVVALVVKGIEMF